jgi:hypothetical protein
MSPVKKTTTDIHRAKDKELIILPHPLPLSKRTAVSSNRKKKSIDLHPSPKNRSTPFVRNVFVACFCFLVLTTGLAITNTVAKKQEAQELTQKARQEFTMAVQHFSSRQFTKSLEAFTDLESTIAQMRSVVFPFLSASRSHDNPSSVEELLLLAQELSRAGQRLSEAGPILSQIPSLLISGDLSQMREVISLLRKEFDSVEQFLAVAKELLTNIHKNPLVPVDIRSSVSQLFPYFDSANTYLLLLNDFFPAAEELLGASGYHTIVILFQNSGEIRATGGFPGSLLTLRFEGDSLLPKFYDIYALSWKVPSDEPPPPGFHRLTKNLTLQDANYSADFPTSAERVRKMLLEAGIPGPITVVAITDQLFSDLLELTGPISVPGYDESLTAENASTLLSFFVEAKAFGKRTPKDIIKELFPELLSRIQSIPPEELLALFERSIQNKRILGHSPSSSLQALFATMGISGEIKNPSTKDYLAVFSANVGGNKSDHFLSEEVFLSTAVGVDGKAINTLQIIRRHEPPKAHLDFVEGLLTKYGSFFVAPEVLRQILGSGENHSYTQVIVPLGSQLMHAKGIPVENIDTDTRFQKTVFSFRFPKVAPGKEESAEIQYSLPGSVSVPGAFDLYYQTQPGRRPVRVSREIVPEKGAADTEFYATEVLEHDVVFSARLK